MRILSLFWKKKTFSTKKNPLSWIDRNFFLGQGLSIRIFFLMVFSKIHGFLSTRKAVSETCILVSFQKIIGWWEGNNEIFPTQDDFSHSARFFWLGTIFPTWDDFSDSGQFLPLGTIFPAWDNFSNLGRFFQLGTIFPTRDDFSNWGQFLRLRTIYPNQDNFLTTEHRPKSKILAQVENSVSSWKYHPELVTSSQVGKIFPR